MTLEDQKTTSDFSEKRIQEQVIDIYRSGNWREIWKQDSYMLHEQLHWNQMNLMDLYHDTYQHNDNSMSGNHRTQKSDSVGHDLRDEIYSQRFFVKNYIKICSEVHGNGHEGFVKVTKTYDALG